MAEAGGGAIHRLSDEDREKLLAQHRAVPKPKVQEVRYALPNLGEILKNVSEILTTTVVSAAIGAVRSDPILAEWTRQGLGAA